jgi:hypothetical protein
MKKAAAALLTVTLFVVLGVAATVGLRVGIPSVQAAPGLVEVALVQCSRQGSVLPFFFQTFAFSATPGVTTTPTLNNCAQTLADLQNIDHLKITSTEAPGSDIGVVYTLSK